MNDLLAPFLMLRPRVATVVAIGALAVLCGCISVPELDGYETKDLRKQRFPKLIPLDNVQTSDPLDPEEATELNTELNQRVADLRRKADALRGPVVDQQTRERLEKAQAN